MEATEGLESTRHLWVVLSEPITLRDPAHDRNTGGWISPSLSINWLPRCLSGKESTCQCRRPQERGFDPWVGKMPWRWKWQPTPIFLPGKFYRQRNLVGCNSWDRRVGHNWACNPHAFFISGNVIFSFGEGCFRIGYPQVSPSRILSEILTDVKFHTLSQGNFISLVIRRVLWMIHFYIFSINLFFIRPWKSATGFPQKSYFIS